LETRANCLRLFDGNGENFNGRTVMKAIEQFNKNSIEMLWQGDELILPTQIVKKNGNLPGVVKDGDPVILFNFHGYRPRKMIRAFSRNVLPDVGTA
jgi:bisphosphoglycerate-independent phosphoglycerate mutase (AlkP superfamily)